MLLMSVSVRGRRWLLERRHSTAAVPKLTVWCLFLMAFSPRETTSLHRVMVQISSPRASLISNTSLAAWIRVTDSPSRSSAPTYFNLFVFGAFLILIPRVCTNTVLMKKAILIVKKTYAFHRKTRNRKGYVVTYVFFDPIGKSKFLVVQEPKMLESMVMFMNVKLNTIHLTPINSC